VGTNAGVPIKSNLSEPGKKKKNENPGCATDRMCTVVTPGNKRTSAVEGTSVSVGRESNRKFMRDEGMHLIREKRSCLFTSSICIQEGMSSDDSSLSRDVDNANELGS